MEMETWGILKIKKNKNIQYIKDAEKKNKVSVKIYSEYVLGLFSFYIYN